MSDLALLAGALLGSAVRFATPLGLAATGETLAERSGVVNVGLEGIMLAGGAAAFLVAHATGSAVLAIVAALLVGVALAGLFAALVLLLRVDQVVCGLGMNLLAFGAAGTAYQRVVGTTGTDALVEPLPRVLGVEPFAYAALALTLGLAWLVHRSTWGVAIRAVGDKPLAADAAGISVLRVRLGAVLAGGALAALAGADLVLAHTRTFAEDLTGGRGFLALAIVLFGRWRPVEVALAALFFGAAQALEVAIKAQGLVLFGWPLARAQELLRGLPYALTLLVLALRRRRSEDAPASLGVPYEGRS